MHGSFSRSNRFLVGAVLLSVASVFCSQGVVAQGPVFLLQAEDSSVDAGTDGSFSILMANDQPLGAFSLGLQHEDWLEVSEIYRGEAVEALLGGLGPSFWFAEITDYGAAAGMSGVVILMLGSDSTGVLDTISVGVNHQLAEIEFAVPNAVPGDTTALEFVSTLLPIAGSAMGPIDIVMVADDGSEYSPPGAAGVMLLAGLVTVELPRIIDLQCQVSDDCGCEVTLSWTNAYPYDSIDIYENGDWVTTLTDQGSGLPASWVTMMTPNDDEDEQESEFVLIAVSNGLESHPVDCEVECADHDTQEPVQNLECERDSDRLMVALEWDLEGEEDQYSTIQIFVDGMQVTEVDAGTEGANIAYDPTLESITVGVLAFNGCGNATSMVECFVPLTETYKRGDVTNNGTFSMEDPVYFLLWVYLLYPDIDCQDAADADDDGILSLTDPVYMLMHLFLQGPAPLPPTVDCGPDPTDDGLLCEDSMLCP
jgi:hypothetical protein